MSDEEKKKVYSIKVSINKHEHAFVGLLNERTKRRLTNRIKAEFTALIELLRAGKSI